MMNTWLSTAPLLMELNMFCLPAARLGTQNIIEAVAFELICCCTFALFFYAWPSTLFIAYKAKKHVTPAFRSAKYPHRHLQPALGRPSPALR